MSYMFRLTVDSSKIIGTDKTDFPVLFNENCSNIPSSFWSNITDVTDGLDVRFYDSTSKSIEYSREVVSVDATGETIESWVQIPSLSVSADTDLYCEVGGGDRTNDTDIWTDLGALGIYHMENTASSVDNGKDATNSDATSITGRIGRCYDFDGTSNYMVMDNYTFLTSNPYYVSAWINMDNTKVTDPSWEDQFATIFNRLEKCNESVSGRGSCSFDFGVDRDAKVGFFVGDNLTNVCSNAGYHQDRYTTDSTINMNTWYHVGVWIEDISQTTPNRIVKFYIDGQLVSSTENISAAVDYSNTHRPGEQTRIGSGYRIGGAHYQNFNGRIDELRIFNGSDFDSSWIETSYNTQSDPASFLSGSTLPFQFNVNVISDYVPGSDKTNFPVMFTQDCSNVPSELWDHVSDTTNGLDIRFYSDSGKSVEYDREIVLYDRTGQKVEAYIKVPTLNASSNTTFVCEIGDATKANDQIWADSSARGIYHLQKSLMDYSPRGLDGTNNGSLDSTGKINDAYSFNDSHVQIYESTAYNDTVAISAWINLNSYPPNNSLTGSPNYGRASIYNTAVICSTTYRGWIPMSFNITPTGELDFWVRTSVSCGGGATTWGYRTDSTHISLYNWHHVMAVINNYTDGATRSLTFYVDGQSVAATKVYTAEFAPVYAGGIQTRIGSQYKTSGVNEWRIDGIIDELRIHDGWEPPDTDWIETDYNNQNDPNTFIICGDVPTPPSTSVPVMRRRQKVNSSGF